MAPSARRSATRASTQGKRSEWLVVDKHLAAEESSLRGRVGAPIRRDAHERGSARTRAVILGGPNDAEVGTVPERIAQAHRDRAPMPDASHALGGHHPSDPTGMSVPTRVADPGLSGTAPLAKPLLSAPQAKKTLAKMPFYLIFE